MIIGVNVEESALSVPAFGGEVNEQNRGVDR